MKQKDGTVQKAGCLDFWVAPGLTYCFCGMGVWKLRIRDIAGDDSCQKNLVRAIMAPTGQCGLSQRRKLRNDGKMWRDG